MARTYAFLGATGNVGKPAALALLKAGHHVRAIVRNPSSDASLALKNAGAELVDSGFVAGDEKLGALHFDEKTLISAFSNVDAIFAIVPPNLQSISPAEEADEFIEFIKRVVQKAENVKRIVFISSFGAQHATGTGVVEKCYRLEQVIGPLAGPNLSIVFVRPGYFMVNFAQSFSAIPGGTFPYAYKDESKVELITPDDVALETAKILQETDYKTGVEIVEISGPAAVSFPEIAEEISRIVGKQITYVPLPSEALVGALLQAGMSPKAAESLVGMVHGIEDGTVDFEFKDKLIRTKTTYKDFVAAMLKQ